MSPGSQANVFQRPVGQEARGSAVDLLCDLGKSLYLSGSQFPHLGGFYLMALLSHHPAE